MQLELALQPNRRPTLLIAASSEAAWQGGLANWFAQVAAEAWQAEHPALVVVPTRGQAQALKARLLEAGLSALGLQFVTPPHLRVLLAGASGTLPPPREHLRLLLALAAEEHLAVQSLSEAERLAAISVRRTPDHLLHLLEQLSAAGSDFRKLTCRHSDQWCENFAPTSPPRDSICFPKPIEKLWSAASRGRRS